MCLNFDALGPLQDTCESGKRQNMWMYLHLFATFEVSEFLEHAMTISYLLLLVKFIYHIFI
jgi:hypothetical protein